MAEIYYDDDADLGLIASKKVAVFVSCASLSRSLFCLAHPLSCNRVSQRCHCSSEIVQRL